MKIEFYNNMIDVVIHLVFQKTLYTNSKTFGQLLVHALWT